MSANDLIPNRALRDQIEHLPGSAWEEKAVPKVGDQVVVNAQADPDGLVKISIRTKDEN